MTRAALAAALQSLLRWTPPITEELVKEWETTAPPPEQVIVACEAITAHRGSSAGEFAPEQPPVHDLLLKDTLDRDDLDRFSALFDEAIAHAAAGDISRLAHVWLIADAPQSIELRAGRRIGNKLIAAAEHRVVQLRRADDFVPGRRSVALVRKELRATIRLLREASVTERQARRLLAVAGELSQLAAWVAADAGSDIEAAGYIRGGVLAARAAGDTPLAANIISTLSYQIANTGDPREAAVLARTAYTGARHHATPAVKALLLERVAWADARSGDLRSCERSLGRVDDQFARAPSPSDPDWVYWLNREEIDVMAGRCYTELRRPDRAEPLLRQAIERYDHSLIRENSLYLSWLAEDYIQLNEIGHAAEIAAHVALLAHRADSARTDTRLRHLADLLTLHKEVPEVAEFLDLYSSVCR
jgi:tetratricopeptide (TPR) repeat protein